MLGPCRGGALVGIDVAPYQSAEIGNGVVGATPEVQAGSNSRRAAIVGDSVGAEERNVGLALHEVAPTGEKSIAPAVSATMGLCQSKAVGLEPSHA